MPFVYFIHEESVGDITCFKIGKTAMHPADRMCALQTGNPRRLVIYRWIELENHSEVEEYLHAKYAKNHIRGEWFNVTKDMIDIECCIISSLGGVVSTTVNAGATVIAGATINTDINTDVNTDVNTDAIITHQVVVSGEYPTYTDEDIIKVQNERSAYGKYKGKYSPREAMRRKKKYWNDRNNAINNNGFSDGL